MKLAGKVAIVTGSGSWGIGRGIALLFGKEGASITVADINEDEGKKTADMIQSAGGKAIFVRCDTSRTEQVQTLVKKTVETFNKLDILVNNAAFNRPDKPVPESVAEMPEEHWHGTINVNLTGYYLCSKYALLEMLKRGSGNIINISSSWGLITGPNAGAYMASKHGINALTKSMAVDYGPKGIRVNTVAPGPIDAPRFWKYATVYTPSKEEWVKQAAKNVPLRRIGTPEDIAKVCLFLASDDSSFVTGVCIPVDGGVILTGN